MTRNRNRSVPEPIQYYRLYRFYRTFSIGKGFRFFIKPFADLIVPEDEIADAIKFLKWDRTIEKPLTVDDVMGASAFVSFLTFLPFYIILSATTSTTVALFIYYYVSLALAVFLYSIPDKITFAYKYQFTFYIPIVMDIMTTVFVQTAGDLSTAILTLYYMKLSEISKIIEKEVISPVMLRKTPETLEERFLNWLQNECPSTLFSESLMRVIVYAQEGVVNPRYFVDQIENTIQLIFNTLEYNAERSSMKMSLTMIFYIIMEIITYLGLEIKNVLGQTVIGNFIGLSLIVVVANPLMLYSILDSAVKRSFAISKLPAEESIKKIQIGKEKSTSKKKKKRSKKTR